MGAFAYLSLRHGTPGKNAVFDSLPDTFEELDQLAKQAGVQPLTSFVAYSAEQLADLFVEEAQTDRAAEQWFEPCDGRKTVDALLDRLIRANDEEDNLVITELKALGQALKAAEQQADKFRLLIEPH
jgi:hypothetical protein